MATASAKLRPYYEDVQSHYDLSDEFFFLFLDPRKVYSCAYFERDDYTLEQAQLAKIDLSLGKCELRPGMRLLDVGCGWGATVMRAAEHYGVRAVGLTLSKNQHQYDLALAAGKGDVEFRLQGWEDFREPVDRIVSIGAFEHFRFERYDAWFERCRDILPPDGKMLLHTIIHGNRETLQPGQPEFDADLIYYIKFMAKHIFPGGQIAPREKIIDHAQRAGFRVTRMQSLRTHYARTLDCWAENFQRNRERAVELSSEDTYEKYLFYLTRSAYYFRSGHVDVMQFSLAK